MTTTGKPATAAKGKTAASIKSKTKVPTKGKEIEMKKKDVEEDDASEDPFKRKQEYATGATGGLSSFDFRMNVLKKDGTRIEANDIMKVLSATSKKWCFQEEISETGYHHWQGRISLIKRKTTKAALEQHIDLMELDRSECFNYFQPTIQGVHKTSNFNYVMKSDTRVKDTEVYTNETHKYQPPVWIPREIRYLNPSTMRPYQLEIYNFTRRLPTKILPPSNDRNILWIYCPEGGIGKSHLLKYLHSYGSRKLIWFENVREIVQDLAERESAMGRRDIPGILFDFPRSEVLDHRFYKLLEILKDGHFTNTRYKGGDWLIESPPIVITANILPDLKAMTSDRIILYKPNRETYELEKYTPEPESIKHKIVLVGKEKYEEEVDKFSEMLKRKMLKTNKTSMSELGIKIPTNLFD